MATAIRNLALVHLERHPEAAARVLERGAPGEAAALLREAAPFVSARLLGLVGPRFAADCFAALPPEAQTAVLSELTPPAGAALLRYQAREAREELLRALPAGAAARLRDALAFPPGSVGASGVSRAATLFGDLSVERAIELLGGHRDSVPDRIVVLDRARRVLGVLRTPTLCWAPRTASVGSLGLETVLVIPAGSPLASLRGDDRWEGGPAPVVDASGAFLGVLDTVSLRRTHPQGSTGAVTQTVAALSELCWVGLGVLLAGRSGDGSRAESERLRV